MVFARHRLHVAGQWLLDGQRSSSVATPALTDEIRVNTSDHQPATGDHREVHG
jgi:hypothetical protein